jgi:Uma2 family endonuclease
MPHVTPDELLRMPDGKSYELVDGELVHRQSSTLTSFVSAEIAGRLSSFVSDHRRGWVFESSNGYECFPHDSGRVRRPNVSFIAKSRLSAKEIDHGWTRIAPDPAVLVVAPHDFVELVETRVVDYLDVGVPVVWVVHPNSRTAYVHRLGKGCEYLVDDVELVGEGPLEGFRVKLADLLPRD